MKLLITGGTGSFGKHFLASALNNPEIDEIVILSRDEWKQWSLEEQYPRSAYPKLRMLLGDVRDPDRMQYATRGVDMVAHAAALKQVPQAEIHPLEYVKTNVLGAANVVKACLANKVKRVVALSTDKAAAPVNAYGATKLCSDKQFIAANHTADGQITNFSVVRYGNVIGSRGSVIPYFLHRVSHGAKDLPITDARMTRFNIDLDQAVEMVWYALANALGGEIFVPKIPSYRILDVAEAIAPGLPIRYVGIRPGEKLHEEMITCADACHSCDLGRYYAILPEAPEHYTHASYCEQTSADPLDVTFSYNSGTNPDFMTVESIREQINLHIDPAFTPVA